MVMAYISGSQAQIGNQNKKGKARAYQVRQVLKAIERLELENDTER